MRYRRSDISGATYFFTVILADRRKTLLLDHVDVLREAIKKVKQNHPFHIDAIVIMPNHLHAMWTLPKDDADFSKRWGLIKANFSRGIENTETISASRINRGERGIWQRRFWEHLIRDDNDYERHVDYIHYNPVKHKYVKTPTDWQYSSVHRFIEKGLVVPDWGAWKEADGEYGE